MRDERPAADDALLHSTSDATRSGRARARPNAASAPMDSATMWTCPSGAAAAAEAASRTRSPCDDRSLGSRTSALTSNHSPSRFQFRAPTRGEPSRPPRARSTGRPCTPDRRGRSAQSRGLPVFPRTGGVSRRGFVHLRCMHWCTLRAASHESAFSRCHSRRLATCRGEAEGTCGRYMPSPRDALGRLAAQPGVQRKNELQFTLAIRTRRGFAPLGSHK